MITIRERAAIAAVLVGLAFPALSSAQDLQVEANQPSIAGDIGSQICEREPASTRRGVHELLGNADGNRTIGIGQERERGTDPEVSRPIRPPMRRDAGPQGFGLWQRDGDG